MVKVKNKKITALPGAWGEGDMNWKNTEHVQGGKATLCDTLMMDTLYICPNTENVQHQAWTLCELLALLNNNVSILAYQLQKMYHTNASC